MNNIILMGPPGAGKTTVASELSQKLNIDWVDIDDDLLEHKWSDTVGNVLAQIGDEAFLKKEAETTLQLKLNQGVISLSGSNPLDEKAMEYIKKIGQVFYLDVDLSIIEGRLKKMKVDRIVGMKDLSLKAILEYRQSFYEKHYDYKIKISKEIKASEIAELIIQQLPSSSMFVSTRGNDLQYGFSNVIEQGLARDGGLYIPKSIPRMSEGEILKLKSCNYIELCDAVLNKFDLGFGIKKMISKAYSSFQDQEITPVIKLKDNTYILELFHGPTAAFKDLALQLTPQFIEKATELKPENRFVLAATSGDTGVAAISGFTNIKGAKICVLYPENGVSTVQKKQMLACQSKDVQVLSVAGDFDHCQSMVKELFSDLEFQNNLKLKGYKLTAANSINWGRLLPQVVYYFYAYLDLLNKGEIKEGQNLNFVVPTGNFGNILAGYVAKTMGLPVGKLVCASNKNNVLTEFLQTGSYDIKSKKLFQTASPSIDILKSSNIERAIYLLSKNSSIITKECFDQLKKKSSFKVNQEVLDSFKENFEAGFSDEKDCFECIKSVYNNFGYLLDPHTAVAYKVYSDLDIIGPTCILATAHYGKFPVAMEVVLEEEYEDIYTAFENIKIRPNIHKKLWSLINSEVGSETKFSSSTLELKSYLLNQL